MAQGGDVGPVEKIRDALAVVAVLVAVGALAFSVTAFVQSGGPDDTAQAIARRTAAVQASLKGQGEKVGELSGRLRSLDRRLTELSENADGILAGGSAKPSRQEVAKLVTEEVRGAVQKMIDELERTGASAGRSKDEEFDTMARSAVRACGAGKKTREVRKVLASMRVELKQLGKKHQPPKKMPWPEFHKKAAPMRNKHLARLRKILSPDQYKKLDGWLKSTKDSYAKRFFGRGG